MNSAHGITSENLLRTFPVSLQEDESVRALAAAAAEVLASRPEEIERLLIYPRIDTLDEELLDILAYDFKVDWWDGDYSLEEKRRTLKDSWRVHRMLGTKAAVETAVSAIFPRSTVQEWFEYGGKPYCFRLAVNVTGSVGDLEKQRRVFQRLNYYKNLRSHLEGVTYTVESDPVILQIGGTAGTVSRMPVPETADDLCFRGGLRFGAAASVISRMPVSETADGLCFRGALRLGGTAALVSRTPVLEANGKER